jgi:hypothetical protein
MYAGTPTTAVTLWSVRVDSAKHLSSAGTEIIFYYYIQYVTRFFETKFLQVPRLSTNHAIFNTLKYKLFFLNPEMEVVNL